MKTKEIDNWKRLNIWFWISVAFFTPLLPAMFLRFFGQFLSLNPNNVDMVLSSINYLGSFFNWLILPLLITVLATILYAVKCAKVLFKNIPAIPLIAFLLFLLLVYLFHLVGLFIIYAVIYFRKKQLGQTISLITKSGAKETDKTASNFR